MWTHSPKQETKSTTFFSSPTSSKVLHTTSALTPTVMQLQKTIDNWVITQFLHEQKQASDAFNHSQNTIQMKADVTGLPDQLKSGLENLSGVDLSDVKVHYNSPHPEKVGALAYAQGNEIHLGTGQEKHLPHEGWHVVQQKQGRVKPTIQMKGATFNDNVELEKEADLMGKRANNFANEDCFESRQEKLKSHLLSNQRLPIQRVSMQEVSKEQKKRNKKIENGGNLREGGDSEKEERYTTVGFEWDIAETKGEENPFQGVTHVEIAKSQKKQFGLNYLLETDASNVIEFVTPPFLVKRQEGKEILPSSDDLSEIISAIKSGLESLDNPSTIKELRTNQNWQQQFGISWKKQNLLKSSDTDTDEESAISWRNWSWNAQNERELKTALSIGIDNVEVKMEIANLPQINIATDSETYKKIEDRKASRLGPKINSYFGFGGSSFNEHVGQIRKNLFEFLDKYRDINLDKLKLFFDQLAQFLVQQASVSSIEELAEIQREGFSGNRIDKENMKKQANKASFIKDTANVWLKSDLLSFGISLLRAEEWKIIYELSEEFSKDKNLSIISADIWDKNTDDKKQVLKEIFGKLKENAKKLKDDTSKGELPAEHSLKLNLINEISKQLSNIKLHDHTPNILGVRQDTFIPPNIMLDLSKKLDINRLLHVMEVRNPEEFLNSLKK